MNNTQIRRIIKAVSMKNMQGNWLNGFFIILIMSLASSLIFGFLPITIPLPEEIISAGNDTGKLLHLFFPNGITQRTIALFGVVAVLNLVVICPMSVGMCRFFLRVAAGQKGSFYDFFSPFVSISYVFSSILLEIIITVVSAFWSVIFMLIPLAVMLFAIVAESPFLLLSSYIMALAAALFSMLWNSRYTFARYIFAEGKTGAFRAFNACCSLIHGRSGELIDLRASYFGWDLASVFFTPISFVYNMLYATVYARYLYHLRGDIKIVVHEDAPREESPKE